MLVSLGRLASVGSPYQDLFDLPVEGIVQELEGPRTIHHRELAVLLANESGLFLWILVTNEGRYCCLDSSYSKSDEEHGGGQPRDASSVIQGNGERSCEHDARSAYQQTTRGRCQHRRG